MMTVKMLPKVAWHTYTRYTCRIVVRRRWRTCVLGLECNSTGNKQFVAEGAAAAELPLSSL